MQTITLQSPAKINLFLKVINKRPDGFHNIETLFQRISLYDDLKFKKNKSSKIHISCNHPHVPTGPKNLVFKVVRLLQQDFGIEEGVDITIYKRIPVAAGLAGGSSNAAYTLLGLNKLWKLDMSPQKLRSYARQIGSDVPFFLYDASWGLGQERGDKIRRLDIKTKLWHILVVPRVKLYSGVVYGGYKMQLTKQAANVNILIHNLKKNNIEKIGQGLSNDLEAEIIRLCPKLLKLKERLKSFNPKGVMISGSGPSTFGIIDTESQAKEIQSILLKRFKQVFVVRTF